MTSISGGSTALVFRGDDPAPARIARSVLAREGLFTDLDRFHQWFKEFGERSYARAELIALDDLAGWHVDPRTGDLGHDSGKFFRVEGLDVHWPKGPVPHWQQPIIRQPEIGILGILVKEFNGVLHLLMQAKPEPGNRNGLQLSPTVQATRSNYSRVHRGKSVPYLEYFRDTARHRLLADVLQSEQGAWFHQKRNRNMVVDVVEDVEVLDGFCWLTLGQIHQLLAVDDLVNMDARTVLSCLPFAGAETFGLLAPNGDGFRSALLRSCSENEGSLHTTNEILRWITETRTRADLETRRVPLADLPDWHRTSARISHTSGLFFDVVGVSVRAGGREVRSWTQPMIQPRDPGVIAFLVKRIGGVLHALVHARVEPGYVDMAELAPTVQCTPRNYEQLLPSEARPPHLDEVLRARPDQIRFEAVFSEEGGRFFHAQNRYLVVETERDLEPESPDYRWMTLHQLVDLLRHSHYLNIQARSLVACMHSLIGP